MLMSASENRTVEDSSGRAANGDRDSSEAATSTESACHDIMSASENVSGEDSSGRAANL